MRHRDALAEAIAVDKGRGQAKGRAAGQVTPGPELNPYAASQPPITVGVQPDLTSQGNLEQTPQRLAHGAQRPRQIMQPPSVPQTLRVPGPAIQYHYAPQLPDPPLVAPHPPDQQEPPQFQRRLHSSPVANLQNPAQPPNTVELMYDKLSYTGLNHYITRMFKTPSWPVTQPVTAPVRAMPSTLSAPPPTHFEEEKPSLEAYPPTPIHILAMRAATFKLQGRSADGIHGPQGFELSPYLPEEWSVLTPEGVENLKQRYISKKMTIEPVPIPEEGHPGLLPSARLKMTELITPDPKLPGKASGFPYFDIKDFKRPLCIKSSNSLEAIQLRAMGFTGSFDHYNDTAQVHVKTIKNLEHVAQLNLIANARQEWVQTAQLKLVAEIQSKVSGLMIHMSPREQQELQDDFTLLKSMSADAARDMERLVPVNTDTLACLNMTRRDLVIDRLRHGEFRTLERGFDWDTVPYAEREDYERLRIAPLFSQQLFPYSHLQEFSHAAQAKKQAHESTGRRWRPKLSLTVEQLCNS